MKWSDLDGKEDIDITVTDTHVEVYSTSADFTKFCTRFKASLEILGGKE
jgi:hypothetical protein